MSKYESYLLFFASKLGRRSFTLVKGEGRVMISAPHSAEQTRNGRKKYGEYLTGVLANMLHDELGCPIICKTKNCKDDANYDEKSRYKQKLKKYVIKNKIGYLIDLHQMNPQRPEGIAVGTGEGRNISADPGIADRFVKCFEDAGIDGVAIDKPFSAINPNTVSSFIARECGIPCVQLEFNTRLLSKRYSECRYDEILSSMAKLIKELNGDANG
ncbi:MAG: N-formylglutamate amidohydrolase [Clostridiales bacterium]|nr:N-formylglutamate amidohydrolase [Clostridiales bacterium]